jgi:aminoglycoside 6'-N-acetyltransferase
MFVIEVGGRPVGLIQSYRVADYPAWDRTLNISGAAGIDFLIGDPADCGRGLGSRAIAQFSRAVFDAYSDVSVIAVAPQAANTASCRALANAGFTFLGLRDLESDDPSEAGPSAIHVLRLDTPPTASA